MTPAALSSVREPKVAELTRKQLRRSPLPAVDDGADKEDRGRVLVIGGSRWVPGAVLLAGVASLRAGAGKLQMATISDASIPLGLAVPESLVVGLPVDAHGEIDSYASRTVLERFVKDADVILVGPGMMRAASARSVLSTVDTLASDKATLVIDGVAIIAMRRKFPGGDPAPSQVAEQNTELSFPDLSRRNGRLILTPHVGEMASLLGVDKSRVLHNPAQMAAAAALDFGATVALKGRETFIATAEGDCLRFSKGCAGLGTSGSGDTLAGIAAGLAARGADTLTATLWAVWAHGMAGRRLARRVAPFGFLAREILDQVPALVGQR